MKYIYNYRANYWHISYIFYNNLTETKTKVMEMEKSLLKYYNTFVKLEYVEKVYLIEWLEFFDYYKSMPNDYNNKSEKLTLLQDDITRLSCVDRKKLFDLLYTSYENFQSSKFLSLKSYFGFIPKEEREDIANRFDLYILTFQEWNNQCYKSIIIYYFNQLTEVDKYKFKHWLKRYLKKATTELLFKTERRLYNLSELDRQSFFEALEFTFKTENESI